MEHDGQEEESGTRSADRRRLTSTTNAYRCVSRVKACCQLWSGLPAICCSYACLSKYSFAWQRPTLPTAEIARVDAACVPPLLINRMPSSITSTEEGSSPAGGASQKEAPHPPAALFSSLLPNACTVFHRLHTRFTTKWLPRTSSWDGAPSARTLSRESSSKSTSAHVHPTSPPTLLSIADNRDVT